MDETEKAHIEELKKIIRKQLDKYIANSPYMYNPDEKRVELTISGMARRKMKQGEFYCPCRRVSGDPEKDRKLICPCVFHKKEIERDGICTCELFVAKEKQE